MNLMPVCKAIQEATGQRVSPPTATRWAMKGYEGVVLRTVRLGKKRLSTVEWVNEFILARCNCEAAPPLSSKTRAELNQLLNG